MAEVLWHPAGRNYAMAIRTARAWSVPPRQIMMGKPVVWNDIDSRLAQALVLLEEETCKSCGMPAWLGHSTNNHIQFEVDKAFCYSCAELEKQQEEDRRKKVNSPGSIPYVRPYNVFEGQPLPSRSDEYERRSK